MGKARCGSGAHVNKNLSVCRLDLADHKYLRTPEIHKLEQPGQVESTKTLERFWEWSEHGRMPIVIDATSCSYTLRQYADNLPGAAIKCKAGH